MTKTKRIVRLVSSTGSGHFYTTLKNRSSPDRLQLMRYDPKARRHALYVEKKDS